MAPAIAFWRSNWRSLKENWVHLVGPFAAICDWPRPKESGTRKILLNPARISAEVYAFPIG